MSDPNENAKLARIARMTDGVYRNIQNGDFEKFSIINGSVEIECMVGSATFCTVDNVSFETFDPSTVSQVPNDAVDDPVKYLNDLLDEIRVGYEPTMQEVRALAYAREMTEISEK